MKRLCAVAGVVAVAFSPGIAYGSTALIVGGAGRYNNLTDDEMSRALGGYFADYDRRVNVPFDGSKDFGQSIDAAADSLYDAVYDTPGRKTIGGVSQSAAAVPEVLRRLQDDPNAPPPGELDAAIYGYPSPVLFRFGGVDYQPLPETPYNLLIVKAEYDGIADFPDNPWNLLAVANALMGARQLHYSGAFSDISQVPEEYITETTNSQGGTTTTVLIPTEVLPLLQPLSDRGASAEFVGFLDSVLRPVVDSAYDRPARQQPAVPARAASSETDGQRRATVGSADSDSTGESTGDTDDNTGARPRREAADAVQAQPSKPSRRTSEDSVGQVSGSPEAVRDTTGSPADGDTRGHTPSATSDTAGGSEKPRRATPGKPPRQPSTSGAESPTAGRQSAAKPDAA